MSRLILFAALSIGQLAIAQPLRYENHSVARILPGCGDAKTGCFDIELDYPQVTSGPLPVQTLINTAIRGFVVDNGKVTPEQYAADSLKDYTPDFPNERFEISTSVTVLRDTPPVFSVMCRREAFMGGAHPQHETRFLNFAAATGARLALSSILQDGSMPKLTSLAEMHFRQDQRLGPADNLAEKFNFPNNRFRLTDNFGIGEKSLIFVFNEYEIAPYVFGAIRIEVPYDEIRGLLRPGVGAAPAAQGAAAAPGAASGRIQIKPLLDDLAGMAGSASLSPDGKTLAFDWCPPGTQPCGIYTRLLPGGPPQRFAEGLGPRWSPDGKTIAFTLFLNRWDVRLVVRSVAGGAERELGSVCESLPSWSPDSRFLAAARDQGEMACRPALFPAAGGQPFRDLAENGASPAFSPDGRLLAYAEAKSLKLLRLDSGYRPAGPPVTLTQEPRPITQVNWTRDSVVYEVLGDVPYLRRLSPGPGAQPQPLAGLSQRLSIFEFLPNGDALAVEIQPVESWWRADLQASPVKIATVSAPSWADGSIYSPDGRQRAFISTRTDFAQILLADADGSKERLLVARSASDELPKLAAWSPDGKWIAFTYSPLTGDHGSDYSNLYVVSVSGGPPRRVAEDIVGPVWSRDSKFLYSSRMWKFGIVRVNLSDGSVTELEANGSSPQLSADGRWLYFLTGPQRGLSRMPAQGGAAEVLRAQPGFVVLWHKLGQKDVYLGETRRGAAAPLCAILRVDPQTRQASPLGEIPLQPSSAWLSADERSLYFQQSSPPKRSIVLVQGL